MQSQHISLLGLMGCGKSTVGERLARALGWSFLDLDALVVADHGPIPEIFAHHGEAAFRAFEHQALVTALSRMPCIISTGGGAVTHEPTRDLLRRTLRVYLDVPLHTLVRRLAHSSNVRPLVGKAPTLERVTELWTARHALYEEAEVHIAGDRPVDKVVGMIIEALEQRGGLRSA